MAIAYDSSANGADNANSWTHVSSGTHRILFVYQWLTGTITPTVPTYNGVSMTLVTSCTNANTGDKVWLYYLLNPSSGSNTVTCSLNNTIGGRGLSVSYNGVSQVGLFDSSNYDSNTVAPPETISTTVVAANCWLIGFCTLESTLSHATVNTSNRTDRQSVNPLSSGQAIFIASDSNGTVSSGSQSMVYTQTVTSGAKYSMAFILSIASDTPIVYTAATLPATFTVTAQSTVPKRVLYILSLPASFIITALTATFQKLTGYIRQIKHTSSFSNQSKDSSVFTKISKNLSSWIDKSKS